MGASASRRRAAGWWDSSRPRAGSRSGRPAPRSGWGSNYCVSRTVRDTAALLDAVRGPGIGDTVIAPAPERPYVDEVGADPGRLRDRAARPPSARRLRARGLRVGGARRGADARGARAHGRGGVAGVPRRRHVAREVHGAVGDADGDGGPRVRADARSPRYGRRHRAGELGPSSTRSGCPPSTTPLRWPRAGPSDARCSNGGRTAGTCCSHRRWPSRRRTDGARERSRHPTAPMRRAGGSPRSRRRST